MSYAVVSRRILLLPLSLVLLWVVTPVVGRDAAPTALAPDRALEQLKQGNDRFAGGEPTHPNASAERRADTVLNGQHPIAAILSCSDSRAPVEVLFDQGLGDVFVVRVAGNVCRVIEAGSIEYAVDHLHTPLVVVVGHTRCGAVTAAVEGGDLHGNVKPLVGLITPAVAEAKRRNPDLSGKDLVPAAIEANVWRSVEELLRNSEPVREGAQLGRLKVVGAIYDLETGRVRWLGTHPDQQRIINAVAPTPALKAPAERTPALVH